jgi:hypothetical protein
MRRTLSVIVAISAVTLVAGPAAATALTQRAAKTFSITVRLIDRNGNRVSGEDVAAADVSPQSYPGPVVGNQQGVIDVRAGTYVVAADIPTLDGSILESDTLASSTRTVNRDLTITLDARKATPVSSALAVSSAVQQDRTATVCARSDYGAPGAAYSYVPVASIGPDGTYTGPTPLYVTATASKYVRFGYQADYKAAGAEYYVADESHAGIPAAPKYQFGESGLARVTLAARTGSSNGDTSFFGIGSGLACHDYGFGAGPTVMALPGSLTQYVSAGPWDATFFPYDKSDDTSTLSRSYAAGHSYVDTFGAAVRGPTLLLPVMADHELSFPTLSLFGDPNLSGSECCSVDRIYLRSGGRLVKRSTLREQGAYFNVHLMHVGWYSLFVSARRLPPPAGVTAAVLSPRITLAWHVDIPPFELSNRALPVSLTRFKPIGLSGSNQAVPGQRTVVKVYIDRTGIEGLAPHRYALRAVRVQESFNDGRVWRQLPVAREHGYWVVTVTDRSKGYVSLRSTVIDARGNSTVETIYRAYGIS